MFHLKTVLLILAPGLDDIIESRFTFELKPQKGIFSREYKGLPEDRFILVVVGIRLASIIEKPPPSLSGFTYKSQISINASISSQYP